MKIIKLIFLFAISVILSSVSLVESGMVSDKFLIYIYYRDGGGERPADNALVKIWEDGNLVDKGHTDSDGIYIVYLNSGTRYRITAEKDERTGEWNDIMDRSRNYKIEIRIMRPNEER
jgi:hypothetical protein